MNFIKGKLIAPAVVKARRPGGRRAGAVRARLQLLERQEQEDQAKLDWLRGATQVALAALDRGEGVQLKAAEDIVFLIT